MRITRHSASTERPQMSVVFPAGLPGFEDVRSYRLSVAHGMRPFLFMDAAPASSLRFVCVSPFLVCPEYEVHMPDISAASIQLDAEGDALVLSIVTVGATADDTTMNLMSPLVINTRNRRGLQFVPERATHPVRLAISQELRRREVVCMAC